VRESVQTASLLTAALVRAASAAVVISEGVAQVQIMDADTTMPITYRIRVKGHLDPTWSAWFDGLSIIHEPEGESVLSGPIMDQAELFGVLIKVHDMNLVLVSVNPAEPES
jgi:hypothetical protein